MKVPSEERAGATYVLNDFLIVLAVGPCCYLCASDSEVSVALTLDGVAATSTRRRVQFRRTACPDIASCCYAAKSECPYEDAACPLAAECPAPAAVNLCPIAPTDGGRPNLTLAE